MFEDISSGIAPRADWRNPEHYQHLLEYDNVGWAGEWLRRNQNFLADLQCAPCSSRSDVSDADCAVQIATCTEPCPLARWGVRCCRVHDRKPVFFWLPQHNPQVLVVEAVTDEADGFDLRQCSLLKAALRGKQKTHLLFSDGARSLQVVVMGALGLDEPVHFRCHVQGWSEFETKPMSLRRLCQLYRQGRLVKALYPKEQRARRWIELLRAWDGLQAGACQREIAAALFGERAAAQDGWETGCRSRAQRLVRVARRMVGGGHFALLSRVKERKDGLGTGEV